MGCLVLGYFLINSGKLSDENPRFHLLNFLGSSGILLSLISAWNLSMFVLETIWAGIAIYGLWRTGKAKKPATKQ